MIVLLFVFIMNKTKKVNFLKVALLKKVNFLGACTSYNELSGIKKAYGK
jgi:hypothetical protein